MARKFSTVRLLTRAFLDSVIEQVKRGPDVSDTKFIVTIVGTHKFIVQFSSAAPDGGIHAQVTNGL